MTIKRKRKIGRPRKRTRGLPSSSYQWKRLYKEYAEKYDKLEARLKKEGVEMETGKVPNMRSFKLTFASMRTTLLEKGQRPSYDRVVIQLVSQSGYKVSRTSAMARRKYIAEYEGIEEKNVSVKDIMMGKKEFTKSEWDQILQYYYELKAGKEKEGVKYSGRAAKEMISSEIFGSP